MSTIHSFLESAAQRLPSKEAMVDENERLTYEQLNKRADNIRNMLVKSVNKQEVISILLDNSINFCVAYFGVLKAGCIAHIVPVSSSDQNFSFQVSETNPKMVITSKKFSSRLERAKIETPCFMIEDIQAYEKGEEREVTENDVSTVIYSSGTTSRPKGVKLQHKNVVNATRNMVSFLDVRESDVYLNVLPLSHSFGLGNVHMTISQGGKVVIERNAMNIPSFLNKMNEENATIFAAVPTTLGLIGQAHADQMKELKNLRMIVTNSTRMPPETTRTLLNLLPCTQIFMYYGLTEASRSTFNHYNKNLDKLESVGPATPHVELKIIDDHGRELPPFQEGEVLIRGLHVIKEYWNNPQADQALKNNGILTGDYGYLDAEGFLYLVGRKDDMINIGGEKVSPLEIEQALASVKGIKEIAAVGMHDRILNQVVHIFVVKEDGTQIGEAEIISAAKKVLEGYKVPRKVTFVEQLPKTDSGKIKRAALNGAENGQP